MTETSLLIAVGIHATSHDLEDTHPTVPMLGQVRLWPDWRTSHIDAMSRWARSLKCHHIDVTDSAFGHWLTTTGVLGDRKIVVGSYASDAETHALRDMAIAGPLELDQIARFARSYPGVA